MSGDPTPSSWFWGGGILSAGVGLKWLWDRISNWRASREAKLEAREESYVAKLEARLLAVEGIVAAQGVELENHRIALHVLIAKVAREDPTAPELKQVADILGSAFPAHLRIPPDMQASLDKLNGE